MCRRFRIRVGSVGSRSVSRTMWNVELLMLLLLLLLLLLSSLAKFGPVARTHLLMVRTFVAKAKAAMRHSAVGRQDTHASFFEDTGLWKS